LYADCFRYIIESVKKSTLIIALLLLAGSSFAATGSNYRSSPEGLLMGGGTSEGITYSTQNAIGDSVIGTATGSAYSTFLGFIAASVTYATREEGAPYISDLQFDGRAIIFGDYVNADVTITALVTNGASSIDTAASSIEVDSAAISFADLTDNSTYDATSGNLTYKRPSPFDTGTHSFKIIARNTLDKTATLSISFNVRSGGPTVVGNILTYPNPFDPTQGPAEIVWRLTTDAKVTLYLFNSLGQPVLKREFAEGSEGGHSGYNIYLWNGISDFGGIVANDIYFCRIVSGGKVIGKGKIAVLK